MPISESRPMKHLRGYLSPQEIRRLIDAWGDERDKLLAWFLYETGARISEVLGLRHNDSIDGRDYRDEVGVKPVNLYPDRDPPQVFLYTIKRTRKDNENEEKRIYDFGERWKTISHELMGRLQKYIDSSVESEDSRIFDFTRVWANKLIEKMSKRAGLKPRDTSEKWIHPHHFRHSFAIKYIVVNSINSIPGIKGLQGILDHRNMMTTFEYMRFSGKEDIVKMFEKEVFPQTAFLRRYNNL